MTYIGILSLSSVPYNMSCRTSQFLGMQVWSSNKVTMHAEYGNVNLEVGDIIRYSQGLLCTCTQNLAYSLQSLCIRILSLLSWGLRTSQDIPDIPCVHMYEQCPSSLLSWDLRTSQDIPDIPCVHIICTMSLIFAVLGS